MELELEEDRKRVLEDMLENKEFNLDQGIVCDTCCHQCSFCNTKPNSSETIQCMSCKKYFHSRCLIDQIPHKTIHVLLYNPSLWWFCLNCVAFYNPCKSVSRTSPLIIEQRCRLLSEEGSMDSVSNCGGQLLQDADGQLSENADGQFSDISAISSTVCNKKSAVSDLSSSIKSSCDDLPSEHRPDFVFSIIDGWSTKDENLGYLIKTTKDDAPSPSKLIKSPICKIHKKKSQSHLKNHPVWKNAKGSEHFAGAKDTGILQESLEVVSSLRHMVKQMDAKAEHSMHERNVSRENLDQIKTLVDTCKIEDIPPPPPILPSPPSECEDTKTINLEGLRKIRSLVEDSQQLGDLL